MEDMAPQESTAPEEIPASAPAEPAQPEPSNADMRHALHLMLGERHWLLNRCTQEIREIMAKLDEIMKSEQVK